MPVAQPLHPPATLLLGALLVVTGGVAAQTGGAAARTDLRDLDLRVTAADIQPAVTIEEYDNRTVERFSVNNNTYMLKITPTAGAPYYLVDEDGSGDMEWRRNAAGLSTRVPQWTLMSW
ncbi:DUF2782 domain-containing protein [uncultured Thiohalocapsa sp.]|uniref:DUF2782 domain-containing protein n=1 Tax=uncultured Thiohalocapsa sp. TaxID=768990 RepID=UPI0025DD6DBA|nr:DUF2782 domain-containing protein [uncultured Thiohalocapsa sp.]